MVVRSVLFPISLTEIQEKALNETIKLYSISCKRCVDVAWAMKKPVKNDVHKLTYYSLKEELGLKSQYLCSSRNRAVEMVKSAMEKITRHKKASKPDCEVVPIRLDARTLSFDKERINVSIATQHGRIKIPLVWHRHASRYEKWDCKAGEIGIDRWGKWFLRLAFEKIPATPPRSGRIYGCDRGPKHPAVISNGKEINKFYGESWWAEHERRLFLLIAKLQSKGTKSARRRLPKVYERLRRFRTDCDRVMAKRIVESLKPGDTIVFEILTNIRDRCGVKGKAHKKHRRKMGRWSFKRLENAIRYYSELFGVYIEYVKAHYTSQTCSRCGVVCKKNRKTQSLYSCSCGLKLNADLNAARNIAYKWRIANSFTSGPPVNRPIVASAQ